MADKQIKFRAVLDSSGFDQQVKQMQDRVSQIARQSNVMQTAQGQFGQGSGMSKLTQSFFGDFNRSSVNELREQFNLNVRQMQHQSRDMREKERELAKLTKLEKEMTEAQKERVKLLQDEVSAIKEKGRTLVEQNNRIASMARGLGIDDLAGAGFKGTGVAPQPQQGFFGRMTGQASNILSQMGGGSVLAGVGTLASRVGGVGLAGVILAGDYIDYYRTRDRQLARNIGESVQSANIGFDAIMQRRGFMNQFENPERQAAMQMAMSERERRLAMDPLRAIGSVGTSALSYGAAGAIGGSLLPGIGTTLGAIGGGLFGAAKGIMGDKGIYSQIFDREAYNAAVNTETLGNFRTNLTALKMSNPEKFMAADIFSQRRGDMQQIQRRLNMTDRELLGDPLQRGAQRRTVGDRPMQELGAGNYQTVFNQETGKYEFVETQESVARRQAEIDQANQGRQEGFLTRSMRDRTGTFAFTEDRIRQNIDQILQAGGTSDFVTQQMGATMAAEYQRGGFTNAAAQLGGISATGNVTAAQTEEQYKKFIAEAMRIGLDSSEFAKETTTANEEVRRAMEAISNVYTRSGGAEGAVDVFQAGMMGGAGAQIQGAETAFQVRNQESGQGTGYRGALKYAFMNSQQGQELFGELPQYLKNAFASYNLENLDEDDPLIREAADKLGISSEEMVDRVRQLQRSGENYSGAADSARQAMQTGYVDYLKKNNLQDTSANRRAFRETKEGQRLTAEAFGMAAQERGDEFLQMSTQAKEAYAFGGIQIPKELRGAAPGLATGGRGAMDAGEGSEAADDATAIQVLSRNLNELTESSKQNRDANMETKIHTLNASTALNEILQFMKEGGEDRTGALLDQLQKQFGGSAQPSMGNKKNK